MQSLSTIFQRRRRALFIGGAVLTLYTLIGFFLVPWIAERQLEGLLQQRLQLSTQFESIYFNPYTFYFAVEGLSLRIDETEEILSLGDFHLNFQPTRLMLLRFKLSELSVSDMDLYFDRQSEQLNTLSLLAQRWAQSAADEDSDVEEPDGDSGIVPLQIDLLQLSNLNLHIVDQVPLTPYATTLSLASAQLPLPTRNWLWSFRQL